LAGAATTRQINDWLAVAGFVDIRVTLKPGSRDLVETWAGALKNPWSSPVKIFAALFRLGRVSPGDPRLREPKTKTWMCGSRPRKTTSGRLLRVVHRPGGRPALDETRGAVIASAAKQSLSPKSRADRDCFVAVLLAMTAL
jgi:hypothetical protein